MNRAKFVNDVIARHRAIQDPIDVRYLGINFVCKPNVFSPFIAPSGHAALSFASRPCFEGKRILDVGSGSGIPACLFGLNGATSVVSVDINPAAVDQGRTNARRCGLQATVQFREGDCFSPIDSDEVFDVIFADLPFTAGKPIDMLERAFHDENLESSRRYLAGLLPRLPERSKTEAFICTSDLEPHYLEQIVDGLPLRFESAMAICLPDVRLEVARIVRG